MRWEKKLYFNDFAFSRKTFMHPPINFAFIRKTFFLSKLFYDGNIMWWVGLRDSAEVFRGNVIVKVPFITTKLFRMRIF